MRVALLVLLLLTTASSVRAQDRDGDRVRDTADLCPDAPEGAGTLFPGDGCPDTDGDHDGIVDAYDVCPIQPETVNGFRDLDGCPDSLESSGASAEAERPPTRLGCWQGSLLVDVASHTDGSARLVPRADGPAWLGDRDLPCYAGATFDGRQSVHCATPDGEVEATLVMRVEAEHAVGMLAVRSMHGLDHRAWTGAMLPAFDRAQVQDAIASHQDAFQACYERAQGEAPTLAGRLVVRLTAAMSGQVESVAVTSDTLSPSRPDVAACVAAIVDAWTIPRPPRCAAVTTSFQIAFSPE